RAALPAACRHRSGFALSAAAHALRELVDREHRPLRHGHRQRSGLRRLRALLTTIQGYIWPVALDAPPAAAPPHRRRRRACAGGRKPARGAARRGRGPTSPSTSTTSPASSPTATSISTPPI